MFELSDFYRYCQRHRVDVIPYWGAPGLGVTLADEGQYAIFLDIRRLTQLRQLRGVCSHEQGHVATGALHKVDSPFELVERSEYRANRWVAQHYITQADFREAFAAGYTEPWELAEFFDLPERDVKNALTYWTQRRGIRFDREVGN